MDFIAMVIMCVEKYFAHHVVPLEDVKVNLGYFNYIYINNYKICFEINMQQYDIAFSLKANDKILSFFLFLIIFSFSYHVFFLLSQSVFLQRNHQIQ